MALFTAICFSYMAFLYIFMLKGKTDYFNTIAIFCLELALLCRCVLSILEEVGAISPNSRMDPFVQQCYFELPYYLYMVVIIAIIF